MSLTAKSDNSQQKILSLFKFYIFLSISLTKRDYIESFIFIILHRWNYAQLFKNSLEINVKTCFASSWQSINGDTWIFDIRIQIYEINNQSLRHQ